MTWRARSSRSRLFGPGGGTTMSGIGRSAGSELTPGGSVGQTADRSGGEPGGTRREAQTDHPDTSGDPGVVLERLDLQAAVVAFDHAPDRALLRAIDAGGIHPVSLRGPLRRRYSRRSE